MPKAKPVVPSVSDGADALYESLSIGQNVRKQLEETASYLMNVTRRTTEQTFELGEHLERAATLLPDGLLDKWVKKRCGFTPRNARLYRAVYRNLAPYKDTLVNLAVGATVLGKLSAVEPRHIEAAIDFAEENGRLKGTDLGAILKGDEAADAAEKTADPFDVGGIDGLKDLIAIKAREGLKGFLAHCEEIQVDVAMALGGKRIVKKDLGAKVVTTARLAYKELESLTRFVTAGERDPYYIQPASFPTRTRWRTVADLLSRISHVDGWPGIKELRAWLEGEVMPALIWATTKARSPEWLLADPKAKVAPRPPVAKIEETPILVPAAKKRAMPPPLPLGQAEIRVQ